MQWLKDFSQGHRQEVVKTGLESSCPNSKFSEVSPPVVSTPVLCLLLLVALSVSVPPPSPWGAEGVEVNVCALSLLPLTWT